MQRLCKAAQTIGTVVIEPNDPVLVVADRRDELIVPGHISYRKIISVGVLDPDRSKQIGFRRKCKILDGCAIFVRKYIRRGIVIDKRAVDGVVATGVRKGALSTVSL